MIVESTNIWDAIVRVSEVAGTLGVAWIAWQQVKTKTKLNEATRKMDQATRRHEETLTSIGTHIINLETKIEHEKDH